MAKFLNPFSEGVSYEKFLKSVPKNKSVKDHLKGKCTPEQIEWLELELKNYNNNKNK